MSDEWSRETTVQSVDAKPQMPQQLVGEHPLSSTLNSELADRTVARCSASRALANASLQRIHAASAGHSEWAANA